ncbi:MAG: hypothetical protein L0Y56_10630, partial [Nitrospira sp.]|nr:hypothetical protein [Nitrospira sp.]
GTIPAFFIEGGAGAYLETVARFAKTLEVETIIPGHGIMSSGAMFGRYVRYLSELMESVRKATRANKTVEETLASIHLEEQYLPLANSPLAPLAEVLKLFHRANVWRTYQELNGRRTS